MANFDQKVTINLDVDTSALSSGLESAKTQVAGAKEELEALDDDLSETDFDIGAEPDYDDIADGVISSHEAAEGVMRGLPDLKLQIEAEMEESAVAEAEAMKQAADASAKATKAKDNFSESNKTAAQRAKDSVKELDKEAQSFDKLDGFGQSLTETKKAVAGANENVQKASRESVRELDDESGSLMRLAESMDVVEEKVKSTSNSSDEMSDAFRRARARTDGMSDSMRAAAQVGNLFEDGLGSLSLNVGAFTIALRNFLTQVPLILTALGAMGAAALGAASAFAALGGAMVALVGVGLLAHAQSLRDEFGRIQDLGQALMVIMRNLGDMMLKAIQPLLDVSNVGGFFINAAEGVAQFVNMLSSAIATITDSGGTVAEFAESVGEDFLSIREAIDSIDGSTLRNLAGSLQVAWALLGDEVLAALEILGDGLANSIEKSSILLSQVEDIRGTVRQFSDTMSSLAEVGFAIGGGLLPIFESFASVVENVASFIANLDSEMVQNAITVAGLVFVFDRLFGVMGNIVNFLPSVILGFKSMIGSAAGASTAVTSVGAAFTTASSGIFSFMASTTPLFAGMTKLRDNLFTLIPSIRSVAFSSAEASKKFHRMALATKLSDDEMEELGDTMAAQKVRAATLSEDIDELADEYRQLAIQGELTEDTISEMDVAPKRMKAVNKLLPDFVQNFNGVRSALVPGAESFAGLNKTMKSTTVVGSSANAALQRMGVGLTSVAKQAGAATVPTSLYAAATQALNLSAIKAAFLQRNFGKALKMAGAQLATATLQTLSYIAAQLGLASSALTAAGASAVLEGALTSLTLGLNKVVGAIIGLILLIGGLAVGVIKNADKIKSSFGGAMDAVSRIIGAVVDLIMGVFIASWDAIKMAISPLINMIMGVVNGLKSFLGSGESSAGIVDLIIAGLSALQSVLAAVIRIIGVIGKVLFTLFITPLKVLISVITSAISKIGEFTNTDIMGGGSSIIPDMVSALKNFEEGIEQVMSDSEDMLNKLITDLNKFIKRFNTITGANIQTFDEVKLTRDETEFETDPPDDMEPKQGATFNMMEDNSTNIDQTVNADPEEKAQLSRVVKDAIAEANSFERRRQGGQ